MVESGRITHAYVDILWTVIEAYSKRAKIAGREEASACGLALSKGNGNYVLRVTSRGAETDYRIDRWD